MSCLSSEDVHVHAYCSKKVQTIVDTATDPWGIKVESVELKHVEVPGEMQRVMAMKMKEMGGLPNIPGMS